MLILTRRIGETLIIGDGDNKIEITPLSTKGNQIRLGITAPKRIPVHREEIYDRIKQGLSPPEKIELVFENDDAA